MNIFNDSERDLTRSVFLLGSESCFNSTLALTDYKIFAEQNPEEFEVKFFYVDVNNFDSEDITMFEEVTSCDVTPSLLIFKDGNVVAKSPWDLQFLLYSLHEYFVSGDEVDTTQIALLKHEPILGILPETSDEDSELELDFCEGPECSIERDDLE